jgi:hypothetical protein
MITLAIYTRTLQKMAEEAGERLSLRLLGSRRVAHSPVGVDGDLDSKSLTNR